MSNDLSMDSNQCWNSAFWHGQDMYITQQIELYEAYTQEILRAIEADDNVEVARVDPQLAEIFEKILEQDPAEFEDKSAQVNYLLNHLVPVTERSKMQEEICEKLVNMLSEQAVRN